MGRWLAFIQTPTVVIDLDEWPTQEQALERARAVLPLVAEYGCACARRSGTPAPLMERRAKLMRAYLGFVGSGPEKRKMLSMMLRI